MFGVGAELDFPTHDVFASFDICVVVNTWSLKGSENMAMPASGIREFRVGCLNR